MIEARVMALVVSLVAGAFLLFITWRETVWFKRHDALQDKHKALLKTIERANTMVAELRKSL